MARGRKPKPVEQRELEENPGHRPLPPAIRTGTFDPVPPSILGPAGREAWKDLTEALDGILDQIDRMALTAMCIQWDRAADADKVLRAQGSFAKGSMGQVVAHPALAMERQAQLAFLKFAAEYAATPVARARVSAANQARAAQEQLEKFIGGGGGLDLTALEEIEVDEEDVIEEDVTEPDGDS